MPVVAVVVAVVVPLLQLLLLLPVAVLRLVLSGVRQPEQGPSASSGAYAPAESGCAACW